MSSTIYVRLTKPNASVMHFATGEMMTFFIPAKDDKGHLVWANRRERELKYTADRKVYPVDSAPYYIRRISDGVLERTTAPEGSEVPTLAGSVSSVDTESAALRIQLAERDSEIGSMRSALDSFDGQWTTVQAELTTLREKGSRDADTLVKLQYDLQEARAEIELLREASDTDDSPDMG